MRDFTNIGDYSGFTNTLVNLSSTGDYLSGIVGTIKPTIDFMYDNFLINPYIIVLIVVLLVLSLFTFGD